MKLINVLIVLSFMVGCSSLKSNNVIDEIKTHCTSDNVRDIHLLDIGKNYREFVTLDVEEHFLEKEPNLVVISIECLGTPKTWTFKANTDYDDPKQKAAILYRATFNLKVIVRDNTENKAYLTRLSYKAKNLHDKASFELIKNIESNAVAVEKI